MTWLVTWIVVNSILIACPPLSAPQPDIYGRESQNVLATTQACFDITSKKMSRVFYTQNEAEIFLEVGKQECSNCTEWKIIRR